MADFIKRQNELKVNRYKHWTFQQMVEHFSGKSFEEVKKEYLEKQKQK